MNNLVEIIVKKPCLVWYVKDKNDLSETSVVEHILNFGNWDDYLDAEKILGIGRIKEIFEKISGGKRVNLRKKTVSYFQKYFQRYA